MYIINNNGEKLQVDDKDVNYNVSQNVIQTVTLVDDSVYLEDVWIANCYNNKSAFQSSSQFETEFIKQKEFNHNPTDEELINFMASNGLSLNDFVEVRKMKKMKISYED